MLRCLVSSVSVWRAGAGLCQRLAAAGGARRAVGAAAAPARSPRFSDVTADDVDFFRGLLGDRGVVTDPDALEPYNSDWMRKYHGRSRLALRPASTEQAAAALARCSARRLAVVPQGGNTGLVGGGVPVHDEIVLSLAAMNKIVSFDESGVLVAQAGCVLQALDEYLAPRGFMMPLDLGAKGSCQIGGNVSTNAGGLRLLRYGSLHGSVLGVEVALADGSVLDLLSVLRKDNTGFDLKQLFIGAEGTIGVVTAVAVQCAPRPASVQLAFLAVPSFAAVRSVLSLAKRRLGEVLSACEFLDAASMATAVEFLPGAANPLRPQQGQQQQEQQQGGAGSRASSGGGGDGGDGGMGQPPFYMLIETHGSDAAHDAEKLERFLEAAMAEGLVGDGTIAGSDAQAASIWRVREGVTEALTRRGPVFKYDLSIPLPQLYALVEAVRARMDGLPGVRVVGYGHVGDGNLHLNVSVPRGGGGGGGSPSSTCGSDGSGSGSGSGGSEGDARWSEAGLSAAVLERLEPFVYEWTSERGGSVSAEHGLGLMKAEAIGYSKPANAVALMARIKALFDPAGILNPYKVLPASATAAIGSEAG